MTTQVNGASKRAVSPRRVLMTGGAGFTGRRVFRAPLDADITVAGAWHDKRDIPHDLKSGLSAVWPEFSEAEK
jgi:nucleoside-diphosphate-sugar epimerase